MVVHAVERRRYGRIELEDPLDGSFGANRVKVLEISITGFRIAHETRFASGIAHDLLIRWHDHTIATRCMLLRTRLWRLAKALGEKSIYHSGLMMTDIDGESKNMLRQLVAERVIRAIDEQKANARGIPPLAAYMYQPGKGEIFRRCEWVDGTWRRTETIHPKQPDNGFTISADVDPFQVEMLCEAWERTTAEGRRLVRLLAELANDKSEGVPTRRYVP